MYVPQTYEAILWYIQDRTPYMYHACTVYV